MSFLKIIPFLLLIMSTSVFAQDSLGIQFSNPSFEGAPRNSLLPDGWFNCGAKEESPPDTQPGAFDVLRNAQNGSTFLGMVVRDNGTGESICAKLDQPLLKGNRYSFSMHLARSSTYNSHSQRTKDVANYNKAAILQIWAGNNKCSKEQLLVRTEKIEKEHWHIYRFVFEVSGDYHFINFELIHSFEIDGYYNGNVLLDNISPIKKITNPPTEESNPFPKKEDFLKMNSSDQFEFITKNYPMVYEEEYNTDDFRKKLIALFGQKITWDFEQIKDNRFSVNKKGFYTYTPIFDPITDFSFFVIADCIQRMKDKLKLGLVIKIPQKQKKRRFKKMLQTKLKEQNLEMEQFEILKHKKNKPNNFLSENEQLAIIVIL